MAENAGRGAMNFEERDKLLIKSINSNIIRAERTEEGVSRLKYLTKVVIDAVAFSLILKIRGDFEHSKEYIETAINANKEVETLLLNWHFNLKLKRNGKNIILAYLEDMPKAKSKESMSEVKSK